MSEINRDGKPAKTEDVGRQLVMTSSHDLSQTVFVIAVQNVHKLFHACLLSCFTHAISWRHANGPAENSPLQWKVILWAHLSCVMMDSDCLNCPEERPIHLVNDMPPSPRRLENLAAFHIEEEQGLGRLRSSALCLAAVALLPPTATGSHKQPIVKQPHDTAAP